MVIDRTVTYPWNYPPLKVSGSVSGVVGHMQKRPEAVVLFGLASCFMEVYQAVDCNLCQ